MPDGELPLEFIPAGTLETLPGRPPLAEQVDRPDEEEQPLELIPRIDILPVTIEPLAFAQSTVKRDVVDEKPLELLDEGDVEDAVMPVRDSEEQGKIEAADPGFWTSFFVGATYNPLTKFAWQKLATPILGETNEQKDARIGARFDEIEANVREKRPVSRFVGDFTFETLELMTGAGIITKVFRKGLTKIASKTVQRLVKGGATGAIVGGADEVVQEAFGEDQFDFMQVAKGAAVEGAIFGIADAGLGKVVDAIRAGRAAKVSLKQKKIIEDVVDETIEKTLAAELIDAGGRQLDETVAKEAFFRKEVKGVRLVTKDNTSVTFDKTNAVPQLKRDLNQNTIKRMSGSDDVLNKSRFKKKITQDIAKILDKSGNNEVLSHEAIKKLMQQGGYGEAGYISIEETVREAVRYANSENALVRLVEDAIHIDPKTISVEAATQASAATERYLSVVQSINAHRGRLLNAAKVKLGSSEAENVKGILLEAKKAADKMGVDADLFAREWAKVDKRDFNEIAKFHRRFVKPRAGDYINSYRYISLLSSPKTWIVNASTNVGQTVLPVFEKTISAATDLIWRKSARGADRTKFFTEVPLYVRGAAGSFRDAYEASIDVFLGRRSMTLLDLNRVPLFPGDNFRAAKIALASPVKIMEAGDIFFRKLIEGGEREALTYSRARIAGASREAALRRVSRIRKLKKGGREFLSRTQVEINAEAQRVGTYRLFRQGLFAEGQGNVLNAVDVVTDKMLAARKKFTIGKGIQPLGFFVPFIQTGSNIFKQGVEFSPLGYLTTIGAKDPIAQVSKATIGTLVTAGAGMLAYNEATTWKTPRNPTERRQFFAANLRPYSIHMPIGPLEERTEDGRVVRGKRWVGFQQLGPLGYPIAFASAFKHYYDKNGGKVAQSESLAKALGGSFTSITSFFSEMTYMQGMGDLIGFMRGDPDKNFAKISANLARQAIPYTAFLGWVDRMAFTAYTDPKTFTEYIKAGLPGFSKFVPTHPDEATTVALRDFPIFNAFFPFGFTEEDKVFVDRFKKTQLRNRLNEFQKKKDEQTLRQRRVELTEVRNPLAEIILKFFPDMDIFISPVSKVERPERGPTAAELKEGGL